jgi:hypothetical protein
MLSLAFFKFSDRVAACFHADSFNTSSLIMGKAVAQHAYGGVGAEEVFQLIHSLGTRGDEWSASRPGRDLSPGKGRPVPIVQETGWAPEPVWTQTLEEKSFASAGDRTSIARSSSP